MIRALSITDSSMLQPAPGKRKASDDGNPLNAIKKRRDTSSKPPSANKRKLLNGEETAGGLVIVRAPSSRPSNPLENSSSSHDPPSRPSSRQRSQQPPEPPAKRLKPDSTAKGKGRESLQGAREDPQVDEDVRQMESEADVLRRKSRAAESSAGFADPSFKFPTTTNPAESRPARRPNHIDAIQPIALSETPQQQRNKALREQGGSRNQGRKSSLSMRGKRISNSYEATGVITQPHTSVSDSSLYKHIDAEIPEPQRARQLLMWASHRAMTASSSSHPSQQGKDPPPPLSPEGAQMLRNVQEQLIKMLADKQIDTNVYNDGSGTNDAAQAKENEQNVKNREREINFMARIERSKAEDQAWVAVSHFYNQYQSSVNEELARRRQSMASAKAKGKQRATEADFYEWDVDDHDLPVHFRGLDGVDLAKKLLSERLSSPEDALIQERLATVEDTLERLHNHAHSAIQTTRAAEDELNRRFSRLNASLAASNVLPSISGHSLATQPSHIPLGTSRQPTADPQELLRALSRIDVERPPSQIGDSARRALMEVQRVSQTAVTERKLAGVPATPRKAPGTPRRTGTPGKR